MSASLDRILSAQQAASRNDWPALGESLHIQAPDAMSALLLRHRLNAMKVEADLIPDGDSWDVRVCITGEDVAAAVQGLMEEEGISPVSSLERT